MTDSSEATTSAARASAPRELQVGPYPCRLTVSRHESRWLACIEVTTADGPVRFCASADEDVIARRLGRHVAAAGFDLGEVFGQVAQGARQLAQSSAVRDVMRTVSDVVREPIVQQAVTFIPGVGPVASTAMRSASTLLDGAQRGERRALTNLGSLVRASRSGHPTAARAMRVLGTVYRGSQQGTRSRFPEGGRGAPEAPRGRRGDVDVGQLLGALFGTAPRGREAGAAGAIPPPPSRWGAPRSASAPREAAPRETAPPEAERPRAARAEPVREPWRDVAPERRTEAEHRAAYEAASAMGLGNAYADAAAVGAWDGARWLWERARPRTPVQVDTYDSRSGYVDGLAAMSQRTLPRLFSRGGDRTG
ncbi:MAG: hypothetical protein SFX73_00770 [Kofleriaceae bacterium]|nr:hypothetical protein [Kofleriaceae bacterium]